MTRFLTVLAAVMLGAVALSNTAAPAAAQFYTNTPKSGPLVFATNTPSGPTPTASPSPSVTPSPTATFTATFTPTPSETPTATPSPTPTPIGPFSYPEGINPLTGQMYPDEAAMSRRNLIVKISNYPPIVRPQTNINLADVVYEFEAEGGVTRFAAIFRSQLPDIVGSVRSARLSDTYIVPMYNALFAYSGTSEPIQLIILGSEWVYQTFSPLKGDNEDAGFVRVPEEGKAFEHTLFLQPALLMEKATRREVNIPLRAFGFAFNETPDAGGLPANDIFIDWYGQTDARWQYDPATGRYLRFTDGIIHTDAATGEQLWIDNVLIIEVEHRERPDLFPAGASYTSTDIVLEGQGRAYLMRDGVYYQGFWRRRDTKPGSALQIIYGDNNSIMMEPGRTWVEVVRGFGDVVLTEDYADMEATATAIFASASPTSDPAADDGD